MHWSLVLVLTLACFAWSPSSIHLTGPTACRCKDPTLCRVLAPAIQFQVEVIVFDAGGSDWKHYDWSKVTTVIATGRYDPDLLCHAHAHDTRVVQYADMPLRLLQNQQNQASWISNKVQLVKRQFMDGISLALDAAVANRSNDYFAMPKLVAKVKKVFQRSIPGSQVTFNVPWSPDCINGQCHDYSEIANSCDSLIVMSFDMQKQMWTDCRAKASAPFYQTISGISAYIKLGIDSRKIVMGVPWYGFNYPCKRFLEAGNCELIGRPYRGAPCSSKIARRLPYKDIMRQLSRSVSGKIWDDDVKAPYFVYKAGEKYHEVWYDDPESISMRATILKKLKLQGISIWFGNYLNYSTDPRVAMQTEEMWNALCPP